MGTLFIKYPNLKGFFTSFYTFDCISIPFLNSAMSTFFLSYGLKAEVALGKQEQSDMVSLGLSYYLMKSLDRN